MNGGEDTGTQELSHTAPGTVNCYNHLEKDLEIVKLKLCTPGNPGILLLGLCPCLCV